MEERRRGRERNFKINGIGEGSSERDTERREEKIWDGVNLPGPGASDFSLALAGVTEFARAAPAPVEVA
jgi:hypothetical protein